MNYEVVYDSANKRSSKDYPMEGTIIAEAQLKLEPTDKELYISMFGFDNHIYEWMSFQHTVSGFNGNFFCRYLYFDIDCADLEQAQEHAKELIRLLYQNLSLSPKQMFICFSGNKGFHIGLHQNLFGGFGYSKDLPTKIRALACMVAGNAYEKTLREVEVEYLNSKPKSFKGLDLGIYNANRIFRAINSLNAKSGLYKIGLTAQELFELTTDQIKELAKSPRTDFRLEHKVSDLTPIADLADLWREASQFNEIEHLKQYTEEKLVNTEAFFAPPVEGDRNNTLFKQAAMIFDHSDFSRGTVKQLIQCVNLASANPLPEREIEAIVKSAYSRTNTHQKPYEAKLQKESSGLETFSHWVEEWADYYSSERKPLTMILPELDAESEQDYRGKLICYIGGPGSMKSYFGQNVVRENISRYGSRCAIASMEMSKVQNVSRFFDLTFNQVDSQSASNYLKQLVKQDKKRFQDEVAGTVTALSGNLLLSNKSGINTSYLRTWLRQIWETHGEVDILLVDGASMMEGSSSDEIAAMAKHTEELKALANETNVCIIVIFHLTKSIKPYERAIIRSARGSGKIIDNGDMFFGFSKLIDESRSTPENLKYMYGYGHINYWNKRGRGQEMDLLFESDPITSVIRPTIRQVEEFPTFEEYSKEYSKKHKHEPTTSWKDL